MKKNGIYLLLGLATIFAIASCATSPEDRATKLASTKGPGWTVPTEEEVAKALDGKKDMQDAARDLVKLKKDKELMFCKRYKEIGSNLPTITCITTAQLRERVDNMNKYRDDMRNKVGKCTMGAGTASGGPCSAGQ